MESATGDGKLAFLSEYARRKKLDDFFGRIPKDARILEVGCGEGWVGKYAQENGWDNFVGVDLLPSANADIVGDINEWKILGLEENSLDAIIAFEVVEHGDFWAAFHALLKPGGRVYVTTPVPHMDWMCKVLESLKLNQKRSSPHTHLIYLERAPHLRLIEKNVKVFMSQWGVLEKPSES